MKIKAQISMVMNLDKCIGCNTCSVTCKNTWTNREGAEYMWFNNVETKPGIGYPKDWENQEFHNPALPTIDNYYEPWTYNYGNLIKAKLSKHQPVIKPISVLTGDPIQLKWGPNWEDDLAGAHITGLQDQNIKKIEEEIKMEYEETFMVAACPSGAIYKIATLEDEKQLYPGQLSLFLDPNDPEVIEQARKDGITDDWIEAAQRSPIYKLAIEQGIALPLHPEYRTLPMVWYVPPLSPIMKRFEDEDTRKSFNSWR